MDEESGFYPAERQVISAPGFVSPLSVDLSGRDSGRGVLCSSGVVGEDVAEGGESAAA